MIVFHFSVHPSIIKINRTINLIILIFKCKIIINFKNKVTTSIFHSPSVTLFIHHQTHYPFAISHTFHSQPNKLSIHHQSHFSFTTKQIIHSPVSHVIHSPSVTFSIHQSVTFSIHQSVTSPLH